ncbi:MAG: helix-turn-helix transcriptional regulator [Synergistaceae bacterium]|nr:helix-turn-helix transcriptional regulator [Synergistaceae bacterium]
MELKETQLSNDAQAILSQPFSARMRLQGTQDLLFHCWSNEDVRVKVEVKKGSEEKKRDNPEACIYRNDDGFICIPGRYIVRSVVEAGRNFQDPRSKKKMAKDLVQAAVISDEILSPILVNGEPTKEWEYDDRQRVYIMRSAITRIKELHIRYANVGLDSLTEAELRQKYLYLDGETVRNMQMMFSERMGKGIMRKRLSEETGISLASLKRYEGGKNYPTLRNYLKLAEYFGWDYKELSQELNTPREVLSDTFKLKRRSSARMFGLLMELFEREKRLDQVRRDAMRHWRLSCAMPMQTRSSLCLTCLDAQSHLDIRASLSISTSRTA